MTQRKLLTRHDNVLTESKRIGELGTAMSASFSATTKVGPNPVPALLPTVLTSRPGAVAVDSSSMEPSKSTAAARTTSKQSPEFSSLVSDLRYLDDSGHQLRHGIEAHVILRPTTSQLGANVLSTKPRAPRKTAASLSTYSGSSNSNGNSNNTYGDNTRSWKTNGTPNVHVLAGKTAGKTTGMDASIVKRSHGGNGSACGGGLAVQVAGSVNELHHRVRLKCNLHSTSLGIYSNPGYQVNVTPASSWSPNKPTQSSFGMDANVTQHATEYRQQVRTFTEYSVSQRRTPTKLSTFLSPETMKEARDGLVVASSSGIFRQPVLVSVPQEKQLQQFHWIEIAQQRELAERQLRTTQVRLEWMQRTYQNGNMTLIADIRELQGVRKLLRARLASLKSVPFDAQVATAVMARRATQVANLEAYDVADEERNADLCPNCPHTVYMLVLHHESQSTCPHCGFTEKREGATINSRAYVDEQQEPEHHAPSHNAWRKPFARFMRSATVGEQRPSNEAVMLLLHRLRLFHVNSVDKIRVVALTRMAKLIGLGSLVSYAPQIMRFMQGKATTQISRRMRDIITSNYERLLQVTPPKQLASLMTLAAELSSTLDEEADGASEASAENGDDDDTKSSAAVGGAAGRGKRSTSMVLSTQHTHHQHKKKRGSSVTSHVLEPGKGKASDKETKRVMAALSLIDGTGSNATSAVAKRENNNLSSSLSSTLLSSTTLTTPAMVRTRPRVAKLNQQVLARMVGKTSAPRILCVRETLLREGYGEACKYMDSAKPNTSMGAVRNRTIVEALQSWIQTTLTPLYSSSTTNRFGLQRMLHTHSPSPLSQIAHHHNHHLGSRSNYHTAHSSFQIDARLRNVHGMSSLSSPPAPITSGTASASLANDCFLRMHPATRWTRHINSLRSLTTQGAYVTFKVRKWTATELQTGCIKNHSETKRRPAAKKRTLVEGTATTAGTAKSRRGRPPVLVSQVGDASTLPAEDDNPENAVARHGHKAFTKFGGCVESTVVYMENNENYTENSNFLLETYFGSSYVLCEQLALQPAEATEITIVLWLPVHELDALLAVRLKSTDSVILRVAKDGMRYSQWIDRGPPPKVPRKRMSTIVKLPSASSSTLTGGGITSSGHGICTTNAKATALLTANTNTDVDRDSTAYAAMGSSLQEDGAFFVVIQEDGSEMIPSFANGFLGLGSSSGMEPLTMHGRSASPSRVTTDVSASSQNTSSGDPTTGATSDTVITGGHDQLPGLPLSTAVTMGIDYQRNTLQNSSQYLYLSHMRSLEQWHSHNMLPPPPPSTSAASSTGVASSPTLSTDLVKFGVAGTGKSRSKTLSRFNEWNDRDDNTSDDEDELRPMRIADDVPEPTMGKLSAMVRRGTTSSRYGNEDKEDHLSLRSDTGTLLSSDCPLAAVTRSGPRSRATDSDPEEVELHCKSMEERYSLKAGATIIDNTAAIHADFWDTDVKHRLGKEYIVHDVPRREFENWVVECKACQPDGDSMIIHLNEERLIVTTPTGVPCVEFTLIPHLPTARTIQTEDGNFQSPARAATVPHHWYHHINIPKKTKLVRQAVVSPKQPSGRRRTVVMAINNTTEKVVKSFDGDTNINGDDVLEHSESTKNTVVTAAKKRSPAKKPSVKKLKEVLITPTCFEFPSVAPTPTASASTPLSLSSWCSPASSSSPSGTQSINSDVVTSANHGETFKEIPCIPYEYAIPGQATWTMQNSIVCTSITSTSRGPSQCAREPYVNWMRQVQARYREEDEHRYRMLRGEHGQRSPSSPPSTHGNTIAAAMTKRDSFTCRLSLKALVPLMSSLGDNVTLRMGPGLPFLIQSHPKIKDKGSDSPIHIYLPCVSPVPESEWSFYKPWLPIHLTNQCAQLPNEDMLERDQRLYCLVKGHRVVIDTMNDQLISLVIKHGGYLRRRMVVNPPPFLLKSMVAVHNLSPYDVRAWVEKLLAPQLWPVAIARGVIALRGALKATFRNTVLAWGRPRVAAEAILQNMLESNVFYNMGSASSTGSRSTTTTRNLKEEQEESRVAGMSISSSGGMTEADGFSDPMTSAITKGTMRTGIQTRLYMSGNHSPYLPVEYVSDKVFHEFLLHTVRDSTASSFGDLRCERILRWKGMSVICEGLDSNRLMLPRDLLADANANSSGNKASNGGALRLQSSTTTTSGGRGGGRTTMFRTPSSFSSLPIKDMTNGHGHSKSSFAASLSSDPKSGSGTKKRHIEQEKSTTVSLRNEDDVALRGKIPGGGGPSGSQGYGSSSLEDERLSDYDDNMVHDMPMCLVTRVVPSDQWCPLNGECATKPILVPRQVIPRIHDPQSGYRGKWALTPWSFYMAIESLHREKDAYGIQRAFDRVARERHDRISSKVETKRAKQQSHPSAPGNLRGDAPRKRPRA